MDEVITIGKLGITVKEYQGQRVVTFKDIDFVHDRPDGTANKRFLDNKERFVEGEDYFLVSNSEIRKSHLFRISDNDYTDKILLTESGYLMLVKSFTDDLAWEVQKTLVKRYFTVKRLVDERLSPETQILMKLVQSLADKELADKERDRQIAEAKETAQKAVETTEAIKEAVSPITDNWRDEINKKFNRIQKSCGADFKYLRIEMYEELDSRGGFDTAQRLQNRRDRMRADGCSKTAIEKLNRMDIIESDKRMREIFTKIVAEYEIRYCA